MTAFRLSKWYMDCVSEDGEAVVLYTAELRWRAVTLHYASVLRRAAGGDARTETSMRACADPVLEGDVLRWASPALGVDARWTLLAGPAESTIFESPDGGVRWKLVSPRARAEITLGDRVVRGLGYAEHLELDVEPWKMPIDGWWGGR